MTSSEEDSVLDIEKEANEAILTIVPQKSKLAYETTYKKFDEWIKAAKVTTINEQVMLAYFSIKSKVLKPTTLWTEYSKLRTMIYLNNNVDIKEFINLIAFMKRQSAGHVVKKSKIFTQTEIEQFLKTACDAEYLLMKVVLIVGVAGACRRDELKKLSITDVADTGEFVKIDINDTKTNISRQFVITNGTFADVCFLGLFRKYASLRGDKTPHNRFFVGYRSGKCIIQPVGINTFAGIPKKIATFLGLPSCDLYTGHCFRRSSATLLADSGAHTSVLKRHGGWKSTSVAESYVEDSVANKCKIAKRILGHNNSRPTSMPSTSMNSRTVSRNISSTNNSRPTSMPSTSINSRTVSRIITSQELTFSSSTLTECNDLENLPVPTGAPTAPQVIYMVDKDHVRMIKELFKMNGVPLKSARQEDGNNQFTASSDSKISSVVVIDK